jgi:hypothetical protein
VVLGGDAQLHSRLVDALMRLTETCARWKEAGASPEECMSISLPVAEALGSLKAAVCHHLQMHVGCLTNNCRLTRSYWLPGDGLLCGGKILDTFHCVCRHPLPSWIARWRPSSWRSRSRRQWRPRSTNLIRAAHIRQAMLARGAWLPALLPLHRSIPFNHGGMHYDVAVALPHGPAMCLQALSSVFPLL